MTPPCSINGCCNCCSAGVIKNRPGLRRPNLRPRCPRPALASPLENSPVPITAGALAAMARKRNTFPAFSTIWSAGLPGSCRPLRPCDELPKSADISGGGLLVRLTRLNHASVVLNSDLIEHIDITPDTVITLTNGQILRVLETAEEVIRRVVDYRRRISSPPGLPEPVDSEP